MELIQDREAEAAERKLCLPGRADEIGRNERKHRRREKAAILKPKPPPVSQNPQMSQKELDQEWWDRHRAQKQGLNLPPSNTDERDRGMDMERAEMMIERKENRRQQRIPKAKGRKEGGGIPGLDIVESYRPMTTALGPRMAVSIIYTILPT